MANSANISPTIEERKDLYHELSQFLRSGIPFPQALDALLDHPPTRRAGRFLRALKDRIAAGDDVAVAFESTLARGNGMDLGMIRAGVRSGRLDRCLSLLSRHCERLVEARQHIVRKLAYPLFALHLAPLLLSLPELMGGGLAEYLQKVFVFLGLVYGIGMVVGVGILLLRELGRNSAAVDALLRSVPLFGGTRTAFATSTFCTAYAVQLDAGIALPEALGAAAAASGSAMARAGVARIVPELLRGSQLHPLLAKESFLPRAVVRSIRVGEETGHIDEELARWSDYYEKKAVAGLNALSAWIPRMLHLALLLYIGWKAIQVYQQAISGYSQLLEP